MAVTASQPRGEPTSEHLPSNSTRFTRALDRMRISRPVFGLVLLLGLFHLFLSYRPLWYTDLWGHLAYGRLIVANGALPRTEPLMPLSQGMRFIDLAWLSQILGYAAFRLEGIAAIQFLYAASITGCLALLAMCVLRRTQFVWPAVLSVAACIWLEWQQFLVVRPQLGGLVCFVLLFAYLTRKKLGRERWIVVSLLLAVWTNLHGSFLIGLAMLAAIAAGRGADLLFRTARWPNVIRDSTFRRLSILIVPACLAVLLNPDGWTIFGDAWETATNPNFADLVEWRPLNIQMRQGQAAAAIALALMVVYRLTPRRISASELLLLVGLGVSTLQSSRMIIWWAPVASYYLAIHAAAIWKRYRRRQRVAESSAERPVSLAWTLATVITVCGVAGVSPLGVALLNGSQPDARKSLSPQTPLAAADYLNAHPPQGQIFNTYEWGDYLLWAGPKGLRVFVASHAHLIPTEVWQDYLRVISLRSGWEKILDRYRVTVAVLDADQHGDLVDALRADDHWSLVFEDDRSAIFARAHPK